MSRTYKDTPRWVQASRSFKRPNKRNNRSGVDVSIPFHHREELVGQTIPHFDFLFSEDGVQEIYRDLDEAAYREVTEMLQARGCRYFVHSCIPWAWDEKDRKRIYTVVPYVEAHYRLRYAPRCTCGEAMKEWGYLRSGPEMLFLTVDGYLAPCQPVNFAPYGHTYFNLPRSGGGRWGWSCDCISCRRSRKKSARSKRARASRYAHRAVREHGYEDDLFDSAADRLTYDTLDSGYYC